MDSNQFAWLYLVEHGVAGCEHSYYGGFKVIDTRMNHVKTWDHQEIIKPI
jgi:hypothetical protein